ncbi:MAG: ABATE domain-containing protein [Rhizomicrobium sp.]|jgi:predicted RNA-binding Zn ribbon-like protein
MGASADRTANSEASCGHNFDMTGGAPALDFCNTVDERRGTPKERLEDYVGLLNWSHQAGILSTAELASLTEMAAKNPRGASGTLKCARALREILFSAFAVAAGGGKLDVKHVDALNKWIRKAGLRRRLSGKGDSLSWKYTSGNDLALDTMLWPVVESAAEILVSDDLRSRIRLCEGPRCAWTFLDFSRLKNRRWCDMSVCGNRAKAQRHYRRSRTGAVE